MFELLALPFKAVFGVMKLGFELVFGLFHGLFGLIFGAIGLIFGLASGLFELVLVGAMIAFVGYMFRKGYDSAKSKSTRQDYVDVDGQRFTSYYHQ